MTSTDTPQPADVDGIPVVWIQPDNQDGDTQIALWLPWLTGTKETAIPFLRELAAGNILEVVQER
jgi:hypothetical protein